MTRLFSILVLFVFANGSSFSQTKDTITVKGWLIYQQDYLLAFFPLKNQSKNPSYKNFLTEEKGPGEKMNGNYSAPPKLLIAKKVRLPVYEYNYKNGKDSLIGKREFYIQPVKYIYEVKDKTSDTVNYDMGAGGWRFPVNGKPTEHWAYYFFGRSGEIFYLTQKDSLYAAKGGRRKTISIYPPD